MFQQSFGNGEVSSDRLANITAPHAVKERIAQVVGDGSIVLVTAVQRGDEIKSFKKQLTKATAFRQANLAEVSVLRANLRRASAYVRAINSAEKQLNKQKKR